jgi:cytochrome c556
MIRYIAFAATIALGATAVYAQNAAGIGARKDAFKAIGGATGTMSKMVKGEAPFDTAAAQGALKTIEAKSIELKGMFGDDTKTGETKVLPVAFEKKADLMARFDKMSADAKAAQAAVKDLDSLKGELPKIGANCGGCHKEYRQPQ